MINGGTYSGKDACVCFDYEKSNVSGDNYGFNITRGKFNAQNPIVSIIESPTQETPVADISTYIDKNFVYVVGADADGIKSLDVSINKDSVIVTTFAELQTAIDNKATVINLGADIKTDYENWLVVENDYTLDLGRHGLTTRITESEYIGLLILVNKGKLEING